ncbi:hypothetical protein PROFUN_15206 [Planoprotostelium fungivorum]|uniref:Uncharacterized protein n=1 Tax=Planoprotostelium fungivorum TaxID=1890364 RepID=A0A2P6MWW8_9EUKA|nr:hypothetical protein PROFUN_15206 [Planoprotostelium fungivorum]
MDADARLGGVARDLSSCRGALNNPFLLHNTIVDPDQFLRFLLDVVTRAVLALKSATRSGVMGKGFTKMGNLDSLYCPHEPLQPHPNLPLLRHLEGDLTMVLLKGCISTLVELVTHAQADTKGNATLMAVDVGIYRACIFRPLWRSGQDLQGFTTPPLRHIDPRLVVETPVLLYRTISRMLGLKRTFNGSLCNNDSYMTYNPDPGSKIPDYHSAQWVP